MKLSELEVVFECSHTVRSVLTGGFSASFSCVEIMQGGFLVSPVGFGDTPSQARRLLCENLSGSRIAINAGKDDRKELQLPDKITWR